MPARNRHDLRAFLRAYTVFRFFTDFAFVYAVYIVYFKIRGLSVYQISLLLAFWCAFVLVFEVPAGALADRWSRKHMLSLGMLSKAVGFGIWIFADSFSLFALGFLFWGIQETFCSGTQEALLYDVLKRVSREADYEKVTGRAHFWSKTAAGISVFLGGFMASRNFEMTIALSSLAMIVGLVSTLFLFEPERSRRHEMRGHASPMREAFSEALKNRAMLRFIVYTAVVLAVVGILDEYEQLFFHRAGLPIAFFGVFTVMRMGMEAVGSRYAHILRRTIGGDSMYLLAFMSGLFLALALIRKSVWLIPVFSLVFLFGSAGEVLVEGGIQRLASADRRATVLSINNLILNGSAIAFILGFGFLSRIRLEWGFYGFAMILGVFGLYATLRERTLRNASE